MADFTLNGVIFHPSNIAVQLVITGTELESADGTPTLMVRTTSNPVGRKRLFTITWEKVEFSTVLALADVAVLNTTFPLGVAEGGTVTVQNTTDQNLSYETASIKPDGSQRYNVTYKVRES